MAYCTVYTVYKILTQQNSVCVCMVTGQEIEQPFSLVSKRNFFKNYKWNKNY